ncbi:efflux RND transporter permease subunit [Cytobacillus sp. Hz8]|uniref:efflux RND transporter permease subunit n=1 Tax=Cytobacillus sp. Hz8 TaxID=3347168 RepID=UPI0035E05D45
MSLLSKWAFKNKAAVTVVVTISLVLGIVSYFTLPMEFLPEADNPAITVATLGQGFDSKTMVDEVTTPIENAVASVKGKTDVFSTTGDGYSQVNISFDSKTDMKEAKAEVESDLSKITLPNGVQKPNVVQLNTNQIPIAEVSLTFSDGLTKANMDKAEKEIVPKFKALDGVGNVSLYGKSDPRVVIQLDNAKMAAYIPLQSVMGILQGQNMAVSIGEKTIDGKMSNLKVLGNMDSLDALKNATIPSPVPNAPKVKLGDIATIKSETIQNSITRINGKDALAIDITKADNASAVTVGKVVNNEAKKISKEVSGTKAEVIFSTSDMIQHSVNTMMREVLMGALFATIVIVLFLRNIRSTVITIVSIPLSLGITLFLLWKSGITLNILTLGGVAVAVGRLVDDSIVVIENIFRKTQENEFNKTTILEAVKEVASAITSSTLTTVAVFLPMGLIQGSLRSFIYPFALTITYSLLTSLVVALTVVPLMSFGMLKKAKLPAYKQPLRYKKVLRWSLNHKFVPILLAIIFFAGSIALYFAMPKGAIDAKNAENVGVTLTYPSQTPIDTFNQKALDFEKKLRDLDGYKYVITQAGNNPEQAQWGSVSNPTAASYTVIMKTGADADKFIKDVKKLKSDFPNGDLSVSAGSMMGTSSGSEITLDLVGKNNQDLITASTKVMDHIKGIKGVNKVSSNQEETKPVYSIKVNSNAANTEQVATQLRALMNPTPIGTINFNNQDNNVYLDAGFNPTSKADLQNSKIMTETGVVSLSNVASIQKSEQSSTVLHKDGDQYLRVSILVDSEKLSVVSDKINKATKNLKLPKGVKLVTGGATTQQASDFADLGLTMLASIGLVYLIMVITFKNLRTPIAILMTLPLASIGAILGLLITRVPIDPTSLFGALMLIGIVVTNAIVLIDRVKQNEEHMIIREAIVEGAATRIRPILMTAVATICAMIPILFGDPETGSLVSKGLAVVVIGGLAVATVLTLVIVPVFYELLYFRKSKKQRRREKNKAANETSESFGG